jgi:hypothetical protein
MSLEYDPASGPLHISVKLLLEYDLEHIIPLGDIVEDGVDDAEALHHLKV